MLDDFRNKFPVTDAQWKNYTSRFKRMKLASKTLLLKEGEVSKKMFLIEKGCLRAGFNNDGKDVTFQFFFENQMVASIESFRKKFPSLVFIETIEPSVVWVINKKDVDEITGEALKIPALCNQFVDIIFERTFDYMKHFLSFIKDTPEQRYANLINVKPEIIQRVPQHYIASYLGISTVHLSRIKNKSAKQNKPSVK